MTKTPQRVISASSSFVHPRPCRCIKTACVPAAETRVGRKRLLATCQHLASILVACHATQIRAVAANKRGPHFVTHQHPVHWPNQCHLHNRGQLANITEICMTFGMWGNLCEMFVLRRLLVRCGRSLADVQEVQPNVVTYNTAMTACEKGPSYLRLASAKLVAMPFA